MNRKLGLLLGVGFGLEVMLASAVFAVPTPNGVFELPARPTAVPPVPAKLVYHKNQIACFLQNAEQVRYYGGKIRKAIPPDWIEYLSTLLTESTYCPWPDGLYMRTDLAEVFLLYSDWQYCSVSPENLKDYGGAEAVQSIADPSTYFGTYRQYTGPCN